MNYTQKEKFTNDICGAGLMLIFVEIAYEIVRSCYYDGIYDYHTIDMWVYIVGGIVLAVGLATLAYAYVKKSGTKACYGGELVVLAFTLALLPGCYVYFPKEFSFLRYIFPIGFVFYYIGKAIYIIRHRNDTVKKPKNKRG